MSENKLNSGQISEEKQSPTAELKVNSSKSPHSSGAEEQILEIFQREDISEKIRHQLQEMIRKELSQMSTLLRESIRAWIIQEKSKAATIPPPKEVKLLDQQLLESQEKNKELEEANKRLKRMMDLKTHENSMMFDALQELMLSPKK